MNRIFPFLCLILLLAGCGGAKSAPPWIAAGHGNLEAFKEDFLTTGASRTAEVHFRNAVEEIKKGGDIDLLGKAWLTRMALQVAVLEEPEDSGYRRIELAESVPVNRNFYHFLKGNDSAVDASLLPESYRPFWAMWLGGDALKAATAIAAIDDPLSRLIASGVAVRHRFETEAILQNAVETASQRGWKTALLSWLERLKRFHEATGNTRKASAVQSRIDLMLPD